ncbi:efflux transporter outer membrane subunit [Sandaracinobacteroides saxicola]|uniref:Efflux transporter outer membrane subunit n=1 Tax=Sandaracinobacteroides saxicola TaxID=2759707 RepID=A0A7G5IKJ0_9SPHN|nr:efflux transporter outer membrane subunit [Sandaracinobacteroides saxicola]QMW23882.1 efflux transporter outer membrane subunit [Sandaracinobacteroides saxicola]
MAGCAGVGELKGLPAGTVPAAFGETTVGMDRAAWWARLRDPALEALVTQAMADAPDVQVALARVMQARAGLDAAGAARLPNVNVDATVTQQRTSLDQFGFTLPPGQRFERERTTFNPAVSASYEADLFGRLAAGSRAARARLDAATADAAATRLTLAGDIAKGVFAVRTLDLRIAAARDSVAQAEMLERLARDRVQAGLVSASEAASAATLTAQAAAVAPALESARAAEVAGLSVLSGLGVAEVRRLLSDGAGLPVADALPVVDVPSLLLQRRPDVAAAEARLRAADGDLAAAVRARYPRLTLTGSLGWLATTTAALFDPATLAASVAGTLSAPLLDFGRATAEVDRNRGARAEALAGYRRAVLLAIGDVEQQLVAARTARERQARLAAAAQAAADAEGLAGAQFRGGLTSMTDWLNARRTKLAARDAELEAQGEALERALLLWQAAGGQG